MRAEILVVDIGMGNLRSVSNVLKALGAPHTVSNDPRQLSSASAVLVPGVGAFSAGMESLQQSGMDGAIREAVAAGKPYFGICLGMQLLATVGEEHGEHPGLGIVPGRVALLRSAGALRLPHIGWNNVAATPDSRLFAGIDAKDDFYFVHSYAFQPDDASVIAARCDYGGDFVVALETGSVRAVQFHPEKSQAAGLALLRNWLNDIYPC